ncbi:MAG: DUF4442 domain-containing protein [Anaerolineae bacterium]|nr:MAG: DUF4442 domain-containing protein [Anaerolineae bacterium]
MKASTLRFLMNIWPPFRGAGIRVRHIRPDYREILVEMPLRWYNRNYVGTHFGGSLCAMTDPFYMLMLIHNLGPEYIVWDRAAHIEFVRPGRGTVHARFTLDDEQVEAIRSACQDGQAHYPEFTVDILDEKNKLVARVKKRIYVKKKEGRVRSEQ